MAHKIIKCIPSLINHNQQTISQLLHPISKKNNLTSHDQNSSLVTRRLLSSCNDKNSASESENLATVLHGIKDLRMEKRPMPKHKDNQVLLQMEVVGVCGSDIHYYLDGKLGPHVLKDPMIMGHESSGTVLECGKDVKSLKPGDQVAIEPQMACRKCKYCKSGNYHLCPSLYFCATEGGNLSRYYVHDADFCHKLPSNLDLEHGALMEPLSIGVHACKRACITANDSVLILGAGSIGLVTLLAAKAYGASRTVVVDVDDHKIKKAIEMGADCGVNVKGCADKDIVKSIHNALGQQPNKSMECSGCEQAFRVGLEATKSGGRFVLVGCRSGNVDLPIMEVLFRQVDVLGVLSSVNDYPTAIELVESGKVDPKPLVTHHFKLEQSLEAFKLASEKTEPLTKILIHANEKWQPQSSESAKKSENNKKC